MPYLLNEEEQNMLRRFYALLDKSELITVSKKKSEYLALQNQINPHFLYNTLEGIRAEALIAGGGFYCGDDGGTGNLLPLYHFPG